MNEITPGKWEIDDDGDIRTDADTMRNLVCKAPAMTDPSVDYWAANARLIIAAKDLLVACRLALGRLQNPLLDTSLFDDVKAELRAAILKAEGTPNA